MPPKAGAQVWPGASPYINNKLTAKQKLKAQEKTIPVTPTKSKSKPKPAAEPESEDEEEEEEETTVKTPTKTPVKTPSKKTPRKATSQTVEFALLKNDPKSTAVIPVDVSVSNEEPQAEPKKKGSGFEKLVKLESADKFEILRSFMLTEGPDEGCQVILIRPAKPFRFLELSAETRAIIYGYYFASKGVVDDAIPLDGKRKGYTNDIYAKTYSNDSKNRVGLLAVNKLIYKEAVQIFYATTIRFDGTTHVIDFMTQIDSSVRPYILNIEVKTYQKASARNAISLLAECKNLKRLHFEHGVFTEGDPQKAARSVHSDAHKFLQAIGAAKGNKEAGLEILSFGKNALTTKDESKGKDAKATKPWPELMVADFKKSLKSKLK